MRVLMGSLIVLVVLIVAGLGFVYTGVFNVAADEPHWGLTSRLIETVREHSISERASRVGTPPALTDPKLITAGAGEYDEMCTGCHLAPGVKDSELRAGLYPQPPSLVEHTARRKPAEQFWIIKHGLKMTGMPAWGVTHDDGRIWGMVAFLQKLPELSPDAYHAMVEQSGGHHHGAEESEDHHHDEGGEDHESGAAL